MKALVLVDLQNDFMPGGPLAVRGGDEVLPVANRMMREYELVVVTQDWHPADHGSFAANHPGKQPGDVIELAGLRQILWPVHCVQHTPGAALAAGLDTSRVSRVFPKGTDPSIDSYSGFYDNGHRRATGLGRFLKEQNVGEVVLLGLATDYCVRYTALDAIELGFATYVIVDGCRGVELHPGDVDRAWDEMRAARVHLIESSTQY